MTDRKWWKEAIVYQIYPRSFKDSNGDGEGDIPGIISKLDYLKDLGVTVVWVSPFFKSPQKDNGYDISDYQDVHEPYGKVSDVEELITACHERGMKILFDLVINHTSEEHPWFIESRSSKDNPKRDWYMWHPGKIVDGVRQPPCNWKAWFGGSAWEWDEATQEYYLHLFLKEQPDLNWENPVTREAIYQEAARFWLEKGCDGFRIDTGNMYSKWTHWPDAPVSDAFTIGECDEAFTVEDTLKYVSKKEAQLDVIIQFELSSMDHGAGRFYFIPQEWKLSAFKKGTLHSQELASPSNDGWAVSWLENHDQARSISRFASDSPEHRVNSAKLLATYLLSLSGTPVIYQGQEIGMINAPQDWSIENDYADIWTQNMWKEIKDTAAAENDPALLAEGERGVRLVARDHSRTPMHWNAEASAGFSASSKTWMRIMESHCEINVANQEGDQRSSLEYYRRLIAYRKKNLDVFVYGDIKIYDVENEKTMLYLKRSLGGGQAAFFALNFSDQPQEFELPSDGGYKFELIKDLAYGLAEVGKLSPYEAQIYVGLAPLPN